MIWFLNAFIYRLLRTWYPDFASNLNLKIIRRIIKINNEVIIYNKARVGFSEALTRRQSS